MTPSSTVLTATFSKHGRVTHTVGVARVTRDKGAGNRRTRVKPYHGVPLYNKEGLRNEWAVTLPHAGKPFVAIQRARTASEARGIVAGRLGVERLPIGATVERVA